MENENEAIGGIIYNHYAAIDWHERHVSKGLIFSTIFVTLSVLDIFFMTMFLLDKTVPLPLSILITIVFLIALIFFSGAAYISISATYLENKQIQEHLNQITVEKEKLSINRNTPK